ncbi:DUF4113 domain-containing protein, partial [Enterobacter hormaechei]|uniref:DUF4113 domain-containing protein n=1 Tax=Enterobacter hormaechei TaxID=158836 RepID=UPI001FB221A2
SGHQRYLQTAYRPQIHMFIIDWNTDDLFIGKTLLHGDVLMWLMKTLLTSGCTNQRGAGHNDFTPTGVSQLNLFDDTQPRSNSNQLMKVMDGINHSGLGKVWFAGRGIAPEWQMKREMLSPAYTTRWSELPVAKL